MCCVSMIHDHYREKPSTWWDFQKFQDYQELVRKAAEYDRLMNQPDCENPEKTGFIEEIKTRFDDHT